MIRENRCGAFALSLCLMAGWLPSVSAQPLTRSESVELFVYGGTPAGIAAAIAAAKDGQAVLLMEPTHRLGGLVTSGLSHTDFHSRESLTGAYLDFSQRVLKHYQDHYGLESPQAKASEGGVFAEPKVNLLVFRQMLEEQASIRCESGYRLVAVDMSGEPIKRLSRVLLESHDGTRLTVACKMAIDATYEGDLMAACGVAYRVGREGKGEFEESLAPEKADAQLQAYNFRFIMTPDPALRVLPEKPKGYRREDFVGVLEVLASGKIDKVFGYPDRCIFKAQTPPLPNGKYDINDVSRSAVRLSLPGKNDGWPNGTQSERDAIFEEHRRDQVGLFYFLQNDETVPERFRHEAQQWGWCRDEFEETQHLPPQLYVREARRMVGQSIYRQADSEHSTGDARARLHLDAIAMGDYGNNCHGTYHDGPRFGGSHGGEFYNPVPPYQIPYGVMVPREVNNLLVPVAVSATHVGFCAIRLEPIWMSLGQAAGHAASQALANDRTVAQVSVRALQRRLHQVGSATIYVSDVLPDHPDFRAVQWWGTQGGLHGLQGQPAKPGQRGANLHGQYYAANPGHAVELDRPLDAQTRQRWRVLASLGGMAEADLSKLESTMTRGEFIRRVFDFAEKKGLTSASTPIPRAHPSALPNSHPRGEVDNPELAKKVVIDASVLPGITVDDGDAELIGKWQYSTHTPPYVGIGYLHDMNQDKGHKAVRYRPHLPQAGWYEVRMSHCSNIRRTKNAKVTIHHADGTTVLRVDEQEPANIDSLFKSLGRFRFVQGKDGWVEISNGETEGKYVIADAVQFLPEDAASGK